MGPEGGEGGGYIVSQGTPDDIKKDPQSVTGKFL
jgi:excinuclease ABC subunit A